MKTIDIYSHTFIGIALFLSAMFGVVAPIVINNTRTGDNQTMTQQPAPEAIASVPSPSSDPAPSIVDFEDMAGLDVATQELLNERYRDAGPADFDKRLRRLEWAVSALSDRVFGKSLLPGEGLTGDDSESPTTGK